MQHLKLFLLGFIFIFSLFNLHGQASKINLLQEIEKQDYDLIVIVKHNTPSKALRASLKNVKQSVQDAEFDYTIKDKRIESLTYKDSRQSCASDKFGKLILGIKDGEVQGCFIADRQE